MRVSFRSTASTERRTSDRFVMYCEDVARVVERATLRPSAPPPSFQLFPNEKP